MTIPNELSTIDVFWKKEWELLPRWRQKWVAGVNGVIIRVAEYQHGGWRALVYHSRTSLGAHVDCDTPVEGLREIAHVIDDAKVARVLNKLLAQVQS
jgi:hypothetical protein